MAIPEFSSSNPAIVRNVQERLAQVNVTPREEIGQHFLVNGQAIDLLAQTVTPGSVVVEVGSGIGHLTERLAEKASKLYAIEIDRRYRPLLDRVTSNHPNVEITYGDALKVNIDRLLHKDKGDDGQIVANIPYHITEPFIHIVASLRLSSVTLVLGKRYTDSIAATSSSDGFGRLSILTSTFFDVETLATIQRDSCYPAPRTESSIVQLRPRESEEGGSNRRDVVFRHLFLTSRQNSTLRKGLKEGLDAFELSRDGAGLSKKERNRKSRSNTRLHLREALGQVNRGNFGNIDQSEPADSASSSISRLSRNAIDKLNIPNMTLDKPFALLNNSELRILYTALD